MYGGRKGAFGWERGFDRETGTFVVGDAEGGSLGEGVVEVDVGIALAVVVVSRGAEVARVTALGNGGAVMVCGAVLLR